MPRNEKHEDSRVRDPDWEEIARSLVHARLEQEKDRVNRNIDSIGHKIQSDERVQTNDLQQLRSSLESLEATVTRLLEDIDEVDPNNPPESVHRSGRAVLQEFLELSRSLETDTELPRPHLFHCKRALDEADTELDELMIQNQQIEYI